MGYFLRSLVARAVLLWFLTVYLAAIFGMTAGPAFLAWRWFREGLHPGLAALLALLAGTLPVMIGVFAMNRGGYWASRRIWKAWVLGWAAFGAALALLFVVE